MVRPFSRNQVHMKGTDSLKKRQGSWPKLVFIKVVIYGSQPRTLMP